MTAALKSAADATGAGFDYLLRTARRETSLDPSAQASTSSARGLFQFIDQTWLGTLKEDGPSLGLGADAADVTKTASGRYVVADPGRRAELLALRDDPQTSALLAGAFTRRNATTFATGVGRQPTDGELYAAHFMGAQGAVDLTRLASASPQASAADSFPAQASANRAIFYEQGRARSAAEVYAKLTSTPAGAVPAPPAQAPSPRVALALQAVSDGPNEPRYNGGVEDDKAAFHSLFKTGRRAPVSAYVQQAWSSHGSAGLASDVGAHRTAKPAPSLVSEIVAPAYAPQPAVAPTAETDRAATATDAVNVAARTRRKLVVPTPAKPAIAVADKPAAAPVLQGVAPDAAATAAQPTRFDIGSYLLSVLTGSPQTQGAKESRP